MLMKAVYAPYTHFRAYPRIEIIIIKDEFTRKRCSFEIYYYLYNIKNIFFLNTGYILSLTFLMF